MVRRLYVRVTKQQVPDVARGPRRLTSEREPYPHQVMDGMAYLRQLDLPK